MNHVFFSPRGDASSRRRRPSDVTPFDVPYLTTTHRDQPPPHPLRRKPKTYFSAPSENVPRNHRNHADIASREAPYTRQRAPLDATPPHEAANPPDARTGSSPRHVLRRKTKRSNLRLANISSAPSLPAPEDNVLPPPAKPRLQPAKPRLQPAKPRLPPPTPRLPPPTPGMGGKTIRHVAKSSERLVDRDGAIKRQVIFVGIKPDLEADIHLDAKIRGSIQIGLY